MSSDQVNNKQFSNWNQGFFKNQETMGEIEREVMNDGPSLPHDDKNSQEEWNINRNERHDILHDVDEDDNSKETGWNLGFFAGQEVMSDAERDFWTQNIHVNNEDLVGKDLGQDIDTSDYDRDNQNEKNEYDNSKKSLADRGNSLRNSLIFADEDIDNINNNNAKRNYIDHDNYDKYLNIKRKKDWLNIYVEILFISIYTFIFLGLLVWDIALYFGWVDTENGNRPNWGLMMIPIIIITIFRSLNSYSMIKILF